jgi:hypothetical protein
VIAADSVLVRSPSIVRNSEAAGLTTVATITMSATSATRSPCAKAESECFAVGELVRAKVETIRAGDELRLPSGRMVRCTGATIDGEEIIVHHDLGSLVAMRRGERWPVERRGAAPGERGAGPAAPAPTLPGMPVAERPADETAPARAPAVDHRRAPAAPSPISGARIEALAGILAGMQWPGSSSFARLTGRQQTAAKQVARFALESLSVVSE